MAYIRDYNTVEQTADAVRITASMPIYEDGDLLLFHVSKDTTVGGAYSFLYNPSGWNVIYNNWNSGGQKTGLWWKIATGSIEQTPGVWNSDTDAMHSVIVSIGEVNKSNPINTFSTTSGSSTPGLTKLQRIYNGLTTTVDDCLLVGIIGTDALGEPQAAPGMMHYMAEDAATVGTSIHWSYKKTAGLVTGSGYMFCLMSNTTFAATLLAIEPTGSATRYPAYVSHTTIPAEIITNGNIAGPNYLMGTLQNPLTITNVLGKDVGYDAAAAVADYGIIPYYAAIGLSPSALPTSKQSSYSGSAWNLASTTNFSDKIFASTVLAANPRDLVDMGKSSEPESGMIFGFKDSSDNHRWYRIHSRDSKPNFIGRMPFCIQPNYVDTSYTTTGSFDPTLVNQIMLYSNHPRGAVSSYFTGFWWLNELVICGGSGSNPVDIFGIEDCGNSYAHPSILRQGTALICYCPLRFGGDEYLYLNFDAATLNFPKISNQNDKKFDFHVEPNKVGLTIQGSVGDTIKITNSVISSLSPFYFRISSGSAISPSASYDFAGLTVVGAGIVSLYPITTFNSVTFSDCSEIDARNCTLENCNISQPKSTDSSSILINQSSSLINCIFSTNVSTDYAIRIVETGSYTLNGISFDGFDYDLRVTATTGTVIINITGDGDTPTSFTDGATVTIYNNVTVTLTGLKDNTEVRVYESGTLNELDGIENVINGDIDNRYFSFSLQSGIIVDIVIHNLLYEYQRINNYEIPTSNSELPIQQRFDRNYKNEV
jgi:hypothetical protein